MSTPEHPDTPPLTRKQLREIRNTGATPVIDAAAAAAAQEQSTAVALDDSPVAPPPVEASLPPVAPLARPAEPVVLPEPPVPDRSVDLGVTPLTRRQARQQERIRTASVPVITPDLAAAYAADAHADTAHAEPVTDAVDGAGAVAEDPFAELGLGSGSGPIVLETAESGDGTGADEAEVVEAEVVEAEESGPVDAGREDAGPEASEPEEPEVPYESEASPAADGEQEQRPDDETPQESQDAESTSGSNEDADDDGDEPESPRLVAPDFGAALLAGGAEAAAPVPPSFDELLIRSGSGSVATPNALILSQTPDSGPILAPVSATGEVLITGSLNLPEGLGSTGHAPGTADGKEVDAVLIDGELPAHSSPTPIAASSAISTTKAPGEIIQPPAPEKGGRLMLTLAITAGVLALALVGVLILAFATGVF